MIRFFQFDIDSDADEKKIFITQDDVCIVISVGQIDLFCESLKVEKKELSKGRGFAEEE